MMSWTTSKPATQYKSERGRAVRYFATGITKNGTMKIQIRSTSIVNKVEKCEKEKRNQETDDESV